MTDQKILGNFIMFNKSIGKGSFSKIYIGKSIFNDGKVAIKKIKITKHKKFISLILNGWIGDWQTIKGMS